mmetsp:Transcript_33377/g.37912  ORF Transcript_33377/g.37912 Transcript_33377/m.37912 type:complete len:211 (+) Transcript_33377:388-1020(+)
MISKTLLLLSLSIGLLQLASLCWANSTSSYSTSDGNFSFSFQVIDSEVVEFTMRAKTIGWMGLGFGSTTKTSSDMIYGYVADGGGILLVDAHGDSTNQPVKDTSQDFTLVSRFIDSGNGTTEIVFRRKLNTGDSDDYVFKFGNEVDFIWAYSNTNTKSHSAGHGANYGTTKLTFFDNSVPLTSIPTGSASGYLEVLIGLPILCLLYQWLV